MKKRMQITDEQRAEALEMALNGESPMPYLKKIGVANPTATWKTLRAWAQKNWTAEIADTLPESFGRTRKKEGPKVELVYDPGIAEEYRREQEAKQAEEQLPGQIEMKLDPEEEIIDQKPEMTDQVKMMRFQAAQVDKIIMRLNQLNDTMSMILRAVRKE